MTNHTSTLIDGHFSREKAKTLLTDMLDFKINYHKFRKFSNEDRFGNDHEHSDKRIKELSEEKKQLTEWLNSLDEEAEIDIDCEIVLQVAGN